MRGHQRYNPSLAYMAAGGRSDCIDMIAILYDIDMLYHVHDYPSVHRCGLRRCVWSPISTDVARLSPL
jgi:hypothetical protein